MEAIQELEKIPVTEWAKIWCELNTWKFPEQLSHVKPEWWDGEKKFARLIPILQPLMDRIKFVIGDKALSREWNRERMTDEEHEKFWADPEKYHEEKAKEHGY